MASIKDVRDGLAIILKYDRGFGDRGPARAGGTVQAEHDVIYADLCVGGTLGEVSPEDLAELERLGWRWDDQYDGWRKFT
jgi:hypothetical protein